MGTELEESSKSPVLSGAVQIPGGANTVNPPPPPRTSKPQAPGTTLLSEGHFVLRTETPVSIGHKNKSGRRDGIRGTPDAGDSDKAAVHRCVAYRWRLWPSSGSYPSREPGAGTTTTDPTTTTTATGLPVHF